MFQFGISRQNFTLLDKKYFVIFKKDHEVKFYGRVQLGDGLGCGWVDTLMDATIFEDGADSATLIDSLLPNFTYEGVRLEKLISGYTLVRDGKPYLYMRGWRTELVDRHFVLGRKEPGYKYKYISEWTTEVDLAYRFLCHEEALRVMEGVVKGTLLA